MLRFFSLIVLCCAISMAQTSSPKAPAAAPTPAPAAPAKAKLDPAAKARAAAAAKAKAAAAAQAALEKKIKADEDQIARLKPFLSDPQIGSMIADRLSSLQCETKVLKLRSALGPDALTQEEQTAIRDKCVQAARQETQDIAAPAAKDKSVTGACRLPIPARLPSPPVSALRTNLTIGGNDVSATKYSAWPVSTTKDTGTQVVGQHSVQVKYFNILRYSYSLGGNVSFTNPPTIPSPLALGVSAFSTSPAPQGSTKSAAPNLAPPPPLTAEEAIAAVVDPDVERFQAKWEAFNDCFNKEQDDVVAIDGAINNAAQATLSTTSAINAVLNSHSQKIVVDYTELRQAAAEDPTFGGFIEFVWPTPAITALQSSITTFRDQYNGLTTDSGYQKWIAIPGNTDAFNFIKNQTDKMLDHLNGLGPASDAATKLQSAQDSVKQWRDHFNAVYQTSVNGFLPTYDAPCDAWFGKGKTLAVKLSTRDLTNPATEDTADLVTVVCNPPLTLTTGLGFSFVPERVPAFVPAVKKDSKGNPVLDASGNPVIVQTLGFNEESKARPLYALQINGGIKEFSSGLGIHGSLGTAIGSANDTTNVEFLAGISLSFFHRAFFVTPAYHLARRTEFISGFKPGDVQGNLTSLPTALHWKSGAALTITFPVIQ